MAGWQDNLAALKAAPAFLGEAIMRPSNIGRTVPCPGWIQQVAPFPKQPAGSAASEGSAAHKVSELYFKGEASIQDMVGRMVSYDKDRPSVYFTQDMADALQLYPDTVEKFKTNTTEMKVEHRMSLSVLDPSDPLLAENRGTGDIVLLDYDQAWLHILDLKFGANIKVKPDSLQYQNYALLAYYNFPHPTGWQRISITGVQPRHKETKVPVTADYTPLDLMFDFQPKLINAMKLAVSDDPPLNPGEWCYFCPAAKNRRCPALQQAALTGTAPEFRKQFVPGAPFTPLPADIFVGTPAQPTPMVQKPNQVVLADPSTREAKECSDIMQQAPLFEIWFAGVKRRSATLASLDVDVPGFELVQTAGALHFRNLDTVVAELKLLGLQSSDIYTQPRLRTPEELMNLVQPGLREFFTPGSVSSLVIQDPPHIELAPVGSGKPKASKPLAGPIEID
jgi:hypothetical protein